MTTTNKPPRLHQCTGFSILETAVVLVILGTLAATVIPNLHAGACADDLPIARDLCLLRNAVDLYESDHHGRCPAATDSVSVDQLLQEFSDADGRRVSNVLDRSRGIMYGPYLHSIPVAAFGPHRGTSGISVSTVPGDIPKIASETAWLYNSADGTFQPYTGKFRADASGRLVSAY